MSLDINNEINELSLKFKRLCEYLGTCPDFPDLPTPSYTYVTVDRNDVEGVFFGENEHFYWGQARFTDVNPGKIYIFEFPDVPGSGPVSGCFSEWDLEARRAKTGSAVFRLTGVEKGVSSVRISGNYSWGSKLPVCIGFIAAKI
ncbi:hypothetical protein QP794_24285 [Paenibacillus sp. UMB7766-LJ446]|uniref:hypothetical protein n=1 Tax=Paenibacillus sp. UMB7766-LJ446 TaxID=3046313 RepID=UPI00254DE34A|nr:hypothetical protein [Paenibacillus sp. UMB7766-LJ446]MDK8193210.1 hypothetical protein [Paenibacillus sp. UMB7766-LJ446]